MGMTKGPAEEVSTARGGGSHEAEPWALTNLQHQQDGWNDQSWIGKESKDLAQEGWEIIFNCLLDDVVHSVFPTGKKRGYVTGPAGPKVPLATAFLEELELCSKWTASKKFPKRGCCFGKGSELGECSGLPVSCPWYLTTSQTALMSYV